MNRLRTTLLAAALVAFATPAAAHEFRPGVLRVDLAADGTLDLRLELDALRDPPAIDLPAGCRLIRSAPTLRAACEPDALRGVITVRGLPSDLDLVAHLRTPDATRTTVLRRDAPTLPLAADAPDLPRYLHLGVEHILGGADHLLFVVGLAAWVRGLLPLLATLTAFTLAHSLTLALAVLELLTLPAPPVEACIALSIVLLARALALGDMSLRTPWRFALACGLLHGLGFAGALSTTGLPSDALAGALLAFNLGVELGQAAIAVLVLILAAVLARLAPRLDWRRPLAYALGALAFAWTIERVLALGIPA